MRYFIELSYNGKAYHGWQNQPNAISVQEVLEKTLSTLLGKSIAIVGAGRTDAGVHAKQMFAHFDVEEEIDVERLTYRLNSFLPKDVAIHAVIKVHDEAHARFDATARTYAYKIDRTKNPFSYEQAYVVQFPLDVEKMNEACKLLLGHKDFQCFSKSNTDVKTYYCTIEHAFWTETENTLVFEIKADRFLRNMVRAIVGTLITIGQGKLQVSDLYKIIESKNRSEAGYSVPAHGLYLTRVEYPESIRK